MIYIDLNLEPLSKGFRFMGERMQSWVIPDTLNRAIDKGYTTAKRSIPRQARLRQADVSPALAKIHAKGKGTSVFLKGSNRHFPGGHVSFNPKQNAAGGALTRWQDSGRMMVKGSFFATMPSGHRSLFRRAGSYTTKANRSTNMERRVYNAKTGRKNSQLPIIDIGWGPAVDDEGRRADKPARSLIAKAIIEGFQTRMKQNYEKAVRQTKSRFGL